MQCLCRINLFFILVVFLQISFLNKESRDETRIGPDIRLFGKKKPNIRQGMPDNPAGYPANKADLAQPFYRARDARSGTSVSAYSVHPGGVSTNLGRNLAEYLPTQGWKLFSCSHSQQSSQ